MNERPILMNIQHASDNLIDNISKLRQSIYMLSNDNEDMHPHKDKHEFKKDYIDAIKGMMSNLGNIFPDKKCVSISITDDSDKEFFGIIVSYTRRGLEQIAKMIFNGSRNSKNEPWTITPQKDYMVEIDGRLLTAGETSNDGLSSSCIAALLMREVEVITSVQSLIDLIGVYDWVSDKYNSKQCFNILKMMNTELNYFVIAHTLYTMNSVFFKAPGELCLATELLRNAELTEQFDHGYSIINKMGDTLTKQSCPKTLTINWLIANMSEYGGKELNITQDRMMALTLRDAYENTSSVIWKKLIEDSMRRNPFKKSAQRYINNGEFTHVTESKKHRGLIGSMKYNGMKSLEDDLFEYSMRAKNIDDENSAILLMRRINNRMGIIYDYLETEDLSEIEKKRWNDLYNKYDELRNMMIKKPIYSRKMYGLFVDYNALMNMNNPENMMTMNTIY